MELPIVEMPVGITILSLLRAVPILLKIRFFSERFQICQFNPASPAGEWLANPN